MSEDSVLAEVRGQQLNAVDQLLPPMMIANIVCAGGLSLLLGPAHAAVLLPWFCLVAALSGTRLLLAIRSNAKARRPSASARAIRSRTVQSAVMGAVFTSVPAWLLTETAGLDFAIVICQLTGTLWAGGLLLATVVPAAVAFVVVTSSIIVAALIQAGLDVEHLCLAALFSAGAVTALRTVFHQSRLFVANQRQQIELARQGAVIGLLLRDYSEQTSDWLWETDEELRYRGASDRFGEAVSLPPSESDGLLLGTLKIRSNVLGNEEAVEALRDHATARRPFRDLIIPFSDENGPRWWSMSGRPTHDEHGSFTGYRGVTSDVTASKQAEARIRHLAHHDALTGLPNRAFFCESLDQALIVQGSSTIAVLSLDLDGFKAVNDRHGHPTGDALLFEVASRIRAAAKSGDVVARFGGDEFVVLDTAVGHTSQVEASCARLIESLSEPFAVGDELVTVGVSIGVSFAPSDGQTSDELLKNSDAALYRAKAEGRGTFRFFSSAMDRLAQERQQIVHDLRMALTRNELVLFYQPYVLAETESVSGCEALVRWFHPTRGTVPPLDFIPLAEESGLIVPIGAWIIEQACRDALGWPSHQRVSVNVSPVQLRSRDFPNHVLTALARSGLSPSRLEIEVTEAVLIDDADGALDILRQVRALGVRVALDDFGTGYSSLSYLRRFPFDKIKIDRTFVKDLDTRHDSQVIVRAIRDMARGFGMTITAEGVETKEQADRLRATGCEELQGYLYSRPKAVHDLDLAAHVSCNKASVTAA